MAEKYFWIHKIYSATANINGSGLELYKPTSGWNAEIIDFFALISLPSMREMPTITPPEGVELMNEREQQMAWNEATATADKKILAIEYLNALNIKVTATEIVVYKITPSYTEYLISYLSAHKMVVVPDGCSIRATIKPLNTGILQGSDTIEFRAIVREFKNKDIDELATQYLGN